MEVEVVQVLGAVALGDSVVVRQVEVVQAEVGK